MDVMFADRRSAKQLSSTIRAYGAKDFSLAGQELERFLHQHELTRGLTIDTVLPRAGTKIRFMARLRNGLGTDQFIKLTRPTDEFEFLKNARSINENLRGSGVEIVLPSLAIKASKISGLIMPYHDFMASRDELDLKLTSAALAKLNRSGEHLQNTIGNSTQQRRLFFLPNLIRRTVLSVPFLRHELESCLQCIRLVYRYQHAQKHIAKVLCHGDVTNANIFRHRGRTMIIDFDQYFFAEPGLDLANLHAGSDEKLVAACNEYSVSYGEGLSMSNLRLAAIYGRFLKHLRDAAVGRDSIAFRDSLKRLQMALDTNF